jgi:cobalamin biosynthesis protein CobT
VISELVRDRTGILLSSTLSMETREMLLRGDVGDDLIFNPSSSDVAEEEEEEHILEDDDEEKEEEEEEEEQEKGEEDAALEKGIERCGFGGA